MDRRGHYVTMIVRSERGPGETEDDTRENEPLPRKDGQDRPSGGVFNLHPEHSKIYVGGFPIFKASVRNSAILLSKITVVERGS